LPQWREAGGKRPYDNVIQPGTEFAPGKFLDLPNAEFPPEAGETAPKRNSAKLFAASGWRLTRVIPTAPVPVSIVDGVPA